MINKCNECLDDQPRKLILKYLNINENEKSDISFDKLYHSTCLINDSYVIDIITGCNKNLINNYKQFLCFAYYYQYNNGEYKVVADYSINKLLKKIKSITGNFEKTED